MRLMIEEEVPFVFVLFFSMTQRAKNRPKNMTP